MFPIILGTLFSLAFSNIEDSEKLKVIDIAVVDNGNVVFKNVFDSLSDEDSDDRLFNVRYVSEEEAIKLLESEKITGYVLAQVKPKVVVSNNGINETVLKYVVDEIIEYQSIVSNFLASSMHEIRLEDIQMSEFVLDIYSEVSKKMNEEVNIHDISSENLSYTMIEFYTLIAMTCLYGGIFAVVSINNTLANMSFKGARVSVSPTSKKIVILSRLLASYVIQLLGLVILFLFTIFVLDVDYGNDLSLVVLTSLVGSLAGLSLGVFVSSIFKSSENTKTSILIAFTMAGCFLSGMMGITMKYVVDSKAPILNKINPAAMITDAFYSLYYFTTRDRFWFNIISLVIFSVILIVVSIFSLRRQRYDSI